MYILGIETSCEETSAAIVRDGSKILSNCTLSSVRAHKRFGGVVPEIASRRQYDYIDRVYQAALAEAKISQGQIDAVAVVNGPGLIGSLLVGVSFAKALAGALRKPLIFVNHLYAHLYPPFFKKPQPRFPFLGFVISGGHTHLYLVKDFDTITLAGKTRDDAAGEVFDKVARSFQLGYPGGPVIDALYDPAQKNAFIFKCGQFLDGFNTSFSGIKTAVIFKKETIERQQNKPLTISQKAAMLSSFQESIVQTLARTAVAAAAQYTVKDIVCGGGVVANKRFREVISESARAQHRKVFLSELSLCSDSAAPVAGLAYHLFRRGFRASVHDGVFSTQPSG
jgi:N6-L-threonylcarbamoyladenine synthase